MKQFKLSLAIAALTAAGFAGSAAAATATDQFEVRITINETCNVLTATDILFDPATPTAGTVDKTGTISVQCTNGTDYTLELDGGDAGDTAARRMTRDGGSETIAYQLYQPGGFTTVWGSGGQAVTGIGAGLGGAYQVDHTVNARATLVGNEPAGSYADDVTVTLTF
ncbi:spore coat protein U [Pseudoxanthomonas broegbernensis]|uniref:Spore coat protein U n=1 Tax=Pseudoxanthomonas broegbernensis TaxID=83619 RepID=A0A7V8K707_9GAMM|nr:spore coat U domain-containing protein [Pseudoxanthomonas broegbernensis]KAF1686302.1 spore coat protein U [Pseudoxanthomonas broegbernensis]MBB6063988.1 spore coat protein U-like protein [Pseudoxanthomonas broegbernensis]